jgi:1,4-alpha-glucan branching enzyme
MAKRKTAKEKVTFSLHAPNATEVLLVGDFTGWLDVPLAMKRDRRGFWKKTVSLPPGQYEYRLLVDGEWRDDPDCPNREPNEFGSENCVCFIRDREDRGRGMPVQAEAALA